MFITKRVTIAYTKIQIGILIQLILRLRFREAQIEARPADAPRLNNQHLGDLLNEGLRRARTANLTARNHPKVWQVWKKDSPNDTRSEDSLLRYLDTDRKRP